MILFSMVVLAGNPPYPLWDAKTRMTRLHELREYGEAEVVAVEQRRVRNAEDPLPFDLGDTLGIADLHAHPLSDLTFDHRIVASGPAPCDGRWHGLRYDLTRLLTRMPEIVGDPVLGELMRHCPRDDFPSWRSWTHEQYGLESLREAHSKGLNLMVVSAMNNQFLCGLSSDYSPDLDGFHIWWPEGQRTSQCTDDVNIHRQLQAAWRVEERESGWLEIALTPGEANHAMAAGRLTWVLGVEGSDYLGPRAMGGIAGGWLTPERDPAGLATRVHDRLERMGVRVVLATHEWNNAVGGASLQHLPIFEAGYNLIRRWRREDEWSAPLLLEQLLLFQERYDRGEYDRFPMPAVRSDLDAPEGRTAQERMILVNQVGLSDYGKMLVQAILGEGSSMILDLTHLSERSIADVKDIVKQRADVVGGPTRGARVIVSHGMPRTLSSDEQDSMEYPIGDATYTWAVNNGGVIGFLPGAFAAQTSPGSGVENSCPGSARSHAQIVHWMSKISPFVALGSDMNGAAVEAVPRYGPYSCSVDVSPEKARQLRLVECLRARGALPGPRDVSRTGLADVRYLPDFLRDIDALEGKVSTAGSWWTAQRFVDTWSGEGRSVPQQAKDAPRLSDSLWTPRDPVSVNAFRSQFALCGSTPEEWDGQAGIRVHKGTHGSWDVTVDTWEGRYPAWYAATVNQAASGAALSDSLRGEGLAVAVDAHGNFISKPLNQKEKADFRMRPSDECSPKDVKEVAR